MTLSSQVCNLELSKRLKELGCKQDSYFNWELRPSDGETKLVAVKSWNNEFTFSAFSVAELGELLPKEMNFKTFLGPNYVQLKIGGKEKLHAFIEADNEANSRAKLLVYLIENNLYDPRRIK